MMGNAHGVLGNAHGTEFMRCVLEIQARTWLSLTPPSFAARDKVVAEGDDVVRRLKSLLNSLDFVETPKTYKPPHVLTTKVLCEADWFIEWSMLRRLMDDLEESEPSQDELGRAKPHLAQCVKRLERGVKRNR